MHEFDNARALLREFKGDTYLHGLGVLAAGRRGDRGAGPAGGVRRLPVPRLRVPHGHDPRQPARLRA